MCHAVISTVLTPSVRGYFAGDVIITLPDSHVFSPTEYAEPSWQIVSMPGLSVDALKAFHIDGTGNARRRLAVDMSGLVASLLSGGSPVVTLSALQAVAMLAATVDR